MNGIDSKNDPTFVTEFQFKMSKGDNVLGILGGILAFKGQYCLMWTRLDKDFVLFF